jgi:FkbM family methyltransferase
MTAPWEGLPSALALWVTARSPLLARGGLRVWSSVSQILGREREFREHWVAARVARDLQYRVPVVVRLGNGMRIKVHVHDHVGGAIIRDGFYEREMVQLVRRLLRSGQTFFDVGAHVGQYSLLASELVGSSGAVHSFEPDPQTFRWLTSNIRRNRLANVRANQLGLSSRREVLQFYLSAIQDIGSNSLRRPHNFSGNVVSVTCVSLDEYLESARVPRIDLLKMDVEGGEGAVLAGATRLLAREDRPLLLIEFEEARQQAFGSSCARLAQSLAEWRYTLFRITGSALEPYVSRDPDTPTFNVLAVPEHRMSEVAGLLGTAA